MLAPTSSTWLSELDQHLQTLVAALWRPEPIVAVQQVFGPGWLWFFESVTLLGNGQGIVLLTAVILWVGGRYRAYAVLGLTLLSLLICACFWLLLSTPRPDAPGIVVRAELPTPSFPSGHVATMVSLWLPLAVFGWLPAVVVGLVISLVMLSRLYLGVHYLGDVLGGLLIGLVVLGAVRPAVRLARRLPPPSRRAVLVLALVSVVGGAGALLYFPHHRWEEVGMVAGAAAGFPLEYRFVRVPPTGRRWRGTWLTVVIGLGGALILLGLGRLAGSVAPLLGPLLAALAALWAVLGTPVLFARVELARQDAWPGHRSAQASSVHVRSDAPSSGSHGRGAGGDEP